MTLRKNAFKNIVGNGENASNPDHLIFQQCFLPFYKHIVIIESYLFCSLLLDQSKM